MLKMGRTVLFALAAAACGSWSAARASTVYVQLGNTGSQTTTTQTPFGVVVTPIASPYGVGVVTTPSGNTVITFTPTAAFTASTNNSGGTGHEVEMDGKLTFTLTFDTPIALSAFINETGTSSVTGNGVVSALSGGVVTETDTLGGPQIGQTQSATFAKDGSWTNAINLGTFGSAYKSYTFSIDNYLMAESDTSATAGSATITKNTFTITIPGGGSGNGNPTPLPPAAWTGLGILPLLYLARRRLA